MKQQLLDWQHNTSRICGTMRVHMSWPFHFVLFTKATSLSLVAKVLSKPRWCGRVFAAGMVSAEDTSRIQAEGYLGRFFRWISWPAWFVLVLLFMCAGGLK